MVDGGHGNARQFSGNRRVFNGRRLALGAGWEAFRDLAIAKLARESSSFPFVLRSEADGSITWPPNIER